MANFETGKLINAEPLMLDNNTRSTWESSHGFYYAWQIEVEMNDEIIYFKAFSKKEDQYSLSNGTDITFQTDWDDSKGLPYAKGIKDMNSQYSRGGGNKGGGGRPQSRPQGRPQGRPAQTHAPAPAPKPAPTGLSDKAILYQAQMAAIKYLQVASEQKELALNLNVIQGMGVKFQKWIKTFDDKKIAIQALNLAIEMSKMNTSLEVNESAITSSKELEAVAALYYNQLTE